MVLYKISHFDIYMYLHMYKYSFSFNTKATCKYNIKKTFRFINTYMVHTCICCLNFDTLPFFFLLLLTKGSNTLIYDRHQSSSNNILCMILTYKIPTYYRRMIKENLLLHRMFMLNSRNLRINCEYLILLLGRLLLCIESIYRFNSLLG